MNGFRRWMSQLMYGRYGMDRLNRLMLIVCLVLLVLNTFFLRTRLIRWIAVVLLILAYARCFSRNIGRRREENDRYLGFLQRFGRGRRRKTGSGRSRKDDGSGKRILICPYCGEKLRVPVGAGRINVKCPHCRQKFTETV